jgi:UDP-glucose 4-epimerase
MSIIITGATGFIGSALLSHFIKNTQLDIYVPRRGEAGFKNGVNYLSCDLSIKGFTSCFPTKIDTIVHLAQSKNYRDFPKQANDIYNINVGSTQELLEWSRCNSVKKFILASSGNVYKRSLVPLSEESPCFPVDYYGRTKLIAELLAESYKDFFNVRIIRIFGVYGPGQTGMLVSRIIERVKNYEQVTLGQNVGLEFTPLFIDDCVNMIHKVLINEGKHSIYNLCGSEKVSLASLAEEVGLALSIKPKFKINQTSPIRLIGDNSRFINEFDYNIQTDIKAGIKKTVNQ